MATLRLRLFGRPDEEVEATRVGDVPQWVRRIYLSYGVDPDSAPLSLSVAALSEGIHHRLKHLSRLLRTMERSGWRLQLDHWDLTASTELEDAAAQAQLEELGVWIIVRAHAPLDEEGNVRWTRPWFEDGG